MIPIEVSFTPTETKWRIADVLLEFKSRNPFFGRGLVIEVQHKNREKDIRRTTYDYIAADYSVAWLEPNHFEEVQLDYSVTDDVFVAYPHSHDWQGGEPLDVGHALRPVTQHQILLAHFQIHWRSTGVILTLVQMFLSTGGAS